MIEFLCDGVQKIRPKTLVYLVADSEFLNELLRSSLTYKSLGIREARNRFAVSASA